jgi:predicted DNA-binding transcriptional regulator YafY
MEKEKSVRILYTNWEGKTSLRTIIPKDLVYISTEWHPEAQWCINAFDLDKNAERTFTCKDIKAWFNA